MTKPTHPREVVLHIDGSQYHHPAGPITPAQIRRIPNPDIAQDKQIWLDIDDAQDRLLAEDAQIQLGGGEHFYSEVPAITLTFDRSAYEVSVRKMTGAELRVVPSPDVAADRDLWLDVPDARDRKIQDEDVITLVDKMRFFTAPGRINPGAAGVDR
ncbi:multiubiquitin domain-containing protein [Williamsia herbipolensis]|uniref:multiubiquitin domain-containing protein n=1 Tax=Williamsia herbipolensis TaxID=1603258 RepID=UPI000ACE6C04|nr:multiubiquitin domain-containing protein [Williamsia herbipolensis]